MSQRFSAAKSCFHRAAASEGFPLEESTVLRSCFHPALTASSLRENGIFGGRTGAQSRDVHPVGLTHTSEGPARQKSDKN